MYWPDVVDLKQFYASPLGQVAARALRRRIQELWPSAPNETILGLGYSVPFLMPYLQEAALAMAFMPAAQGAIYWPPACPNLAVLGDEGQIPLRDNMVNRVLMVHMLENSEQRRRLLQEVWRVLTPNGRLLVVAPNRRGVWARAAGSPFAYGQPFTASQLRELLLDHQLTPTRTAAALFALPSERPLCLSLAPAFEEMGRRWCPAFGGVLLMEAEKQIYASTREAVRAVRRPRAVSAQAQPAMMRE